MRWILTALQRDSGRCKCARCARCFGTTGTASTTTLVNGVLYQVIVITLTSERKWKIRCVIPVVTMLWTIRCCFGGYCSCE